MQNQWLIATSTVASGLGIIATQNLKKGERVKIPVLWSSAGAVYTGETSHHGGAKAHYFRKAGESEAVSTWGAVESVRKISGPASYLNDGCPRCANIKHADGGNHFQDFVCTKPVPKGMELKFSYSVVGLTGEETATDAGDTPDEYQCCSAGGN